MTYLQVFENQTVFIAEQQLRGKPVLPEKYALQLQRLENRLPADTLRWSLNRIVFLRCGVIQVGDCSIEILPRIGCNVIPARDVLIRMLKVAGHFLSASPAYHPRRLNELCLLDRHIFQFCEDLAYQIRRGMIRVYVNHHHTLPVVRGRLLLNQQLQLNNAIEENAACEYDELSVDNSYNQVLKNVLKLLSRLATAGTISRKVNELLNYFGAISDHAHDRRDISKLHFDRASSRYEPIFKHCQQLLQNLEMDLASGDIKSFYLLFDMESLFKRYFSVQVQKYQWGKGVQFKTGGPRKHLARDAQGERKYVLLQPDLSILNSKKELLALVHIKWNSIQDRNRKAVVSPQDLSQLVSYAACYNVQKVFLVYPEQARMDEHSMVVKVNGVDVEVVVLYVDISESPGVDWGRFTRLVPQSC